MIIKKDKNQTVEERMHRLHIFEEDLIEKFILGSGSGGQKINKTSSCVYLQHIPTGFEVKCQRERSRDANRYIAREELCDKIEAKMIRERLEKKALASKIKRQNRRPSANQKAKNVDSKRLHSQKKNLRKSRPEE